MAVFENGAWVSPVGTCCWCQGSRPDSLVEPVHVTGQGKVVLRQWCSQRCLFGELRARKVWGPEVGR